MTLLLNCTNCNCFTTLMQRSVESSSFPIKSQMLVNRIAANVDDKYVFQFQKNANEAKQRLS
jgi:hypothetical protein